MAGGGALRDEGSWSDRSSVQRALFAGPVDWAEVDLELTEILDPAKRLETLRAYSTRAPDDANGTIRLCRALAKAGLTAEALQHARRLHERGLMSPLLLREVGDLLTANSQGEEAVRTYSEIVEFDPSNLASRRLLGDIYLGRGWYDAAYRQYRTLTDLQPTDFTAWLRLASSAAGSGRLDEALRLERKVAEAEGTPGPDDPRRWARGKRYRYRISNTRGRSPRRRLTHWEIFQPLDPKAMQEAAT